jgi:hypothetical protein
MSQNLSQAKGRNNLKVIEIPLPNISQRFSKKSPNSEKNLIKTQPEPIKIKENVPLLYPPILSFKAQLESNFFSKKAIAASENFLPKKEAAKQLEKTDELKGLQSNNPINQVNEEQMEPMQVLTQDSFVKPITASIDKPIDTTFFNVRHTKEDNKTNLFFGAKVGLIGYSPLGNGNIKQESISLNPMGGIVMGFRKNNYVFSFEPVLLKRAGLNGSKTNSAADYHFGKNQKEVKVTTKSIQWIELPISFGFLIKKRHSFHLGFYTDILINGKTEITLTEESELNNGTQTTTRSGIPNGIKPYDLGILAAYKFSFSNSSSLGIQVNLGFSDLTLNSYFGNNVFDRNKGLQVFYQFQKTKQ